MKVLYFIITFLLVSNPLYSYNPNNWTKVDLPAGINSEILKFKISGLTTFISTEKNGFFTSDNLIYSWQNIQSVSNITKTDKILVEGLGYFWAADNNQIYFSSDVGKTWQIPEIFKNNQTIINNISFANDGRIAISHSNGIAYRNLFDLELDLYDISDNLPVSNVLNTSIGSVNCLYILTNDNNSNKIYFTGDKGKSWQLIPHPDKSKLDKKFITFAGDTSNNLITQIDNNIYYYNFKTNTWENLSYQSSGDIKEVLITETGEIVSILSNSADIYSTRTKTWTINHEEFSFDSEIIDAEMNNFGHLNFITRDNIFVANWNIAEFLDKISQGYRKIKFKVVDKLNQLLGGITFSLYIGECDNSSVYSAEISTDNNGEFELEMNPAIFNVGDFIKIEKKVFTQMMNKHEQEAIDNVMYDIYLSNLSLDSLGIPSYYKINDNDVQTLKLSHPTVRLNLIISVEWEADQNYLDTVKSWCQTMSNYFYDVTNGQLRLNKVAIYDNKKNWKFSDIQIRASNLEWPNANFAINGKHWTNALTELLSANIRMPRIHVGNKDFNRDVSNRPNWLSSLSFEHEFLSMPYTMAHEIGHWFFGYWDEYDAFWPHDQPAIDSIIDKDKFNYGFMCKHYFDYGANPMSSEKSSKKTYSDPSKRITRQIVTNSKDCWAQFKDRFDRVYNLGGKQFYVKFDSPDDLTGFIKRDYMLGPLDKASAMNQCEVGSLTEITIFNDDLGAGTNHYSIRNRNGFRILDGLDIKLFDRDDNIRLFSKTYYGHTHFGRANLVGVRPGDYVLIQGHHADGLNPLDIYTFFERVSSVSMTGKVNDEFQSDSVEIIIDKNTSSLRTLNQLSLNKDGEIDLNILVNNKPDFDLSYSYLNPNDEPIQNTLTTEENNYSGKVIPKNSAEGTINVHSLTNEGNSYSYQIEYAYYRNLDSIQPRALGLNQSMIFFDTTALNDSEILLYKTNYPTIWNGLEENSVAASEVFGIHFKTEPDNNAKHTAFLNYDNEYLKDRNESEVSAFKWDIKTSAWSYIPSFTDTLFKKVHFVVDGSGLYGLFTRKTEVSVNEIAKSDNDFDFSIQPNPAQNFTHIEFESKVNTHYKVRLISYVGQILFEDELSGTGELIHYNISLSNIPAGYYYTLITSDKTKSLKLLKVVR